MTSVMKVCIELRRCLHCGVEYTFTELKDGTLMNPVCPMCHDYKRVVIK